MTATNDLLLALLRGEDAEIPDWDALIETATRMGVAPLLYSRVRAKDPPEALRRAYLSTGGRNTLLYAQLQELSAALQAEGIPVIVLKGAFLAEKVYGNRALRPMLDIDLLLDRKDLPAAARLLGSLGYAPIQPYEETLLLELHKHLPAFVRRGAAASVELHWSIAEPGAKLPIPYEELLGRAVSIDLAGSRVLVLSTEDLLLHLCLHVSYGHAFAFGLRPFCDVAVLARLPLDWNAVAERAHRWRISRGLHVTLRIAKDWMGAEIPRSVLEATRPPGDVDEILSAVRERVFWNEDQPLSKPLARMWETPGWRAKLALVRERVFLDPKVAQVDHGVAPGGIGFYLWYLRRLASLLWRFVPQLARLLRGQKPATRIVRSMAAIESWLDAE